MTRKTLDVTQRLLHDSLYVSSFYPTRLVSLRSLYKSDVACETQLEDHEYNKKQRTVFPPDGPILAKLA